MQRYPWYADNVRELFSYIFGGLSQLARALALHARGHQFDSDILHRCNWLHIGQSIVLHDLLL